MITLACFVLAVLVILIVIYIYKWVRHHTFIRDKNNLSLYNKTRIAYAFKFAKTDQTYELAKHVAEMSYKLELSNNADDIARYERAGSNYYARILHLEQERDPLPPPPPLPN